MTDQNDAPQAEATDSLPAASGDSWEVRFKKLQSTLQARSDERDDYARQLGEAQAALRQAEDRYAEMQALIEEDEYRREPLNLPDRPMRRPLPPEKPIEEKSRDELVRDLKSFDPEEFWRS